MLKHDENDEDRLLFGDRSLAEVVAAARGSPALVARCDVK